MYTKQKPDMYRESDAMNYSQSGAVYLDVIFKMRYIDLTELPRLMFPTST
jgi:hypothetical protein